MKTQWLHAGTTVYFDENDIYETFSKAEDYKWHIISYLMPYIKNKEIIDFGCGTGKYTAAFAWYATHIHAIDASPQQVYYTKQRTLQRNTISYYAIADGRLPATDASCLIACRVLWTIKDIPRRSIVFNNMIKSLPKWCAIYLIENDSIWSFEEIRWKIIDEELPTITYNRWLEQQWCIEVQKIDTHFQFQSTEQAVNTFTAIRWQSVWKKITSARIEHKVIIYKYIV